MTLSTYFPFVHISGKLNAHHFFAFCLLVYTSGQNTKFLSLHSLAQICAPTICKVEKIPVFYLLTGGFVLDFGEVFWGLRGAPIPVPICYLPSGRNNYIVNL